MESKLITLSAFVQQVDDEMGELNMEGRCDMEEEALILLYKVCKHKDFLKRTLTLGDFIPCEDGKPLDKPSNYLKWIECQEQGLELFFTNYEELLDYQAAQSRVVFEGWKSCHRNAIKNEKGDTMIFLPGRVLYDEKVGTDLYESVNLKKHNPTFADLAAATIDNPIKLKGND